LDNIAEGSVPKQSKRFQANNKSDYFATEI
jgi:hypothetical protein